MVNAGKTGFVNVGMANGAFTGAIVAGNLPAPTSVALGTGLAWLSELFCPFTPPPHTEVTKIKIQNLKCFIMSIAKIFTGKTRVGRNYS